MSSPGVFQRGVSPRTPLKGFYEIKLLSLLRAPARTRPRVRLRTLWNPAVKVATAPFKTPSQGEGFATAHNLPLRTPSKEGVTHLGGLLSNDNAFRYWWRLADPSGGSVCYAVRRNKKYFYVTRPPEGRNSHKPSRGDEHFRRRSARQRKSKPL